MKTTIWIALCAALCCASCDQYTPGDDLYVYAKKEKDKDVMEYTVCTKDNTESGLSGFDACFNLKLSDHSIDVGDKVRISKK